VITKMITTSCFQVKIS